MKLDQIILATSNAHKIEEIRAILAPSGLRLLTRRDFPGHAPDPVESGETYRCNSIIKATTWADFFKIPALADDSGLEVEALGGAPGIHSARYAPTSAERIAKLLDALRDVPAERRAARFVCCAALAWPTTRVLESKCGARSQHCVQTLGICTGRIAFAPAGTGGFGYDPVFLVDGCGGLTMAELPAAEKNRISHRARALAALLANIRNV